MSWFPLTLICAFCIASADAAVKAYFSDYSAWDLVLIRFVAPALLLLPFCLLNPIPAVPVDFYLLMLLLVILELSAMFLYVLALRDSPLHLTLPYLSFTPVFNILTGYVFLDEAISAQGAAGIFLVFFGAYLLNTTGTYRFDLSNLIAPLKAFARERGSRLMLLAAGIYSFTSVLSKKAMEYTDPLSFGPFYYSVIGLVSLLLYALIRPRGLLILTRRIKAILLMGILMAGMVVTHFLAIAQVEVAYMLSVKRMSLLFGILYGALLFKERHLAKHLFAGTLMVAGVYFILV